MKYILKYNKVFNQNSPFNCMVLDWVKKDIERNKELARVLHGVLFFASNEGKLTMPSVEKFILSEVVNGTIAYIGGEAGRVTSLNHRLMPSGFEVQLWQYFQTEMDAHSKGKLNPRIRKAIYGLCEPHRRLEPAPDRGIYLSTELYAHFNGVGHRFCGTFSQSTFSPEAGLIYHLKEEVLPEFSGAELRSIQGIGEAARPFVEEDVRYIRERFHW